MNFDQYMPVRLITGRGCIRANVSVFSEYGEKCLIVTGGASAKKSGALADVTAVLEQQGIRWTLFDRAQQNPLLLDCLEAGEQARVFGAQFVVGIGGGSPLDSAKAAAVFAANSFENPLEIYNLNWQNPALPLILISTTAGTGSEVAPFAVLTKPNGRKRSISSEQIYARVAFGDAAYMASLPLEFTISTALDALSHALEAYYALNCTALSDLYAREAVRLLYPALATLRAVRAVEEITVELREVLYYASVLAGFALARCGTSYCHSLGYFLSEEHGVPHGQACAATLPDFIHREARLVTDKTKLLYYSAGCTKEELCMLIKSLTVLPGLHLPAAEIEEIVSRYDGSPNFVRTAPKGYSREEAVQLLTSLYGG